MSYWNIVSPSGTVLERNVIPSPALASSAGYVSAYRDGEINGKGIWKIADTTYPAPAGTETERVLVRHAEHVGRVAFDRGTWSAYCECGWWDSAERDELAEAEDDAKAHSEYAI